MIDIENDVLSHVASRLRAAYPGISVDSEYSPEGPASFPAVTMIEADNRIFERMRTVKLENAVRVMYEVNVYSNKTNGKKMEAKKITETLDEAFEELGFTRTMRNQIPNFKDATIHRIVARYEATVGPAREEGKYLIYEN